MSNEVRMINGHISMGTMLRSSLVVLSDFCMRPVARDQAEQKALSGEETRIHEWKAPKPLRRVLYYPVWPVTPYSVFPFFHLTSNLGQ